MLNWFIEKTRNEKKTKMLKNYYTKCFHTKSKKIEWIEIQIFLTNSLKKIGVKFRERKAKTWIIEGDLVVKVNWQVKVKLIKNWSKEGKCKNCMKYSIN